MAKLEFLNQWSSQNLTLFPSPTHHMMPICAAWRAQVTPFQKGDSWAPPRQHILGLSVLYLKLQIFFQMATLLRPYLKTHEFNKDRFKFLKSVIRSFLIHYCIFWLHFLFSTVHFTEVSMDFLQTGFIVFNTLSYVAHLLMKLSHFQYLLIKCKYSYLILFSSTKYHKSNISSIYDSRIPSNARDSCTLYFYREFHTHVVHASYMPLCKNWPIVTCIKWHTIVARHPYDKGDAHRWRAVTFVPHGAPTEMSPFTFEGPKVTLHNVGDGQQTKLVTCISYIGDGPCPGGKRWR